jgi:hypothetical protein
MSVIHTFDLGQDSPPQIPLDQSFWRRVAAIQSAEDAAEEAGREAELDDIQSLKNELAVWRSKGGGDSQEVVRLLDQAELGHVKWGQVLSLQILSYQTGDWILFNPPKASLRSLQAWYSFVRWELNWTGPIRVAVAA